jgi:hypothetical protein
MIFKQYENGSCDIEFSKEEINIINKNKKLHLSDDNLKHFGNNLVKIVMEWQLKFNQKTQDMKTYNNKVDSK